MLARVLQRRLSSSSGSATLEIEDTLKIASLVHSFRNDGHLAAALDPLRRVSQGPWHAESRRATTWCVVSADVCLQGHTDTIELRNIAGLFITFCRNNSKLGTLLHGLPLDASHQLNSSELASRLGLSLPVTDDR